MQPDIFSIAFFIASPIPFEGTFSASGPPVRYHLSGQIPSHEPKSIRARYELRLVSGKVKRNPVRAPFGKVPVKAVFCQTDDFIDPQNLREHSGFRKPSDGLDVLEIILVQNALAGHLRAF